MNKTLRWFIALLTASLISYSLFAALGQLVGESSRGNFLHRSAVTINFIPIACESISACTAVRQEVESPIVSTKQSVSPRTDPSPEQINVHPKADPKSTIPKPIFKSVPTEAAPVSIAKHTPTEPESHAAIGIQPIYKVEPVYPMFAITRGIEGWVTIEFLITENGNIVDSKVIASEPPTVFDQTALTAVSRWRYPHGSKSKSSVHIKFELQ